MSGIRSYPLYHVRLLSDPLMAMKLLRTFLLRMPSGYSALLLAMKR